MMKLKVKVKPGDAVLIAQPRPSPEIRVWNNIPQDILLTINDEERDILHIGVELFKAETFKEER